MINRSSKLNCKKIWRTMHRYFSWSFDITFAIDKLPILTYYALICRGSCVNRGKFTTCFAFYHEIIITAANLPPSLQRLLRWKNGDYHGKRGWGCNWCIFVKLINSSLKATKITIRMVIVKKAGTYYYSLFKWRTYRKKTK